VGEYPNAADVFAQLREQRLVARARRLELLALRLAMAIRHSEPGHALDVAYGFEDATRDAELGERNTLRHDLIDRAKGFVAMDESELGDFIASILTPHDVAEWHEGRMSGHMRLIVDHLVNAEVQVWGSQDGPEPLRVVVHI
jgi:hypothetical protein